LKRLIQHIAILFAVLSVSLTAFAQRELDKSRLNVGQTPKKTTDLNLLTFKPVKVTTGGVNLKTSYSKYYRDRLLVSNSKGAEAKVVSNPAVEVTSEKIIISNIYPNPASQYATIDYTIQRNFNEATISFYNLLGKQIGEFDLNKSSDKLRVNVSNWESGIYMYKLTVDGRKVSTKKLLVNRN
jgi:Secretion system C-terminal sorting domain